MDSGDVMARLMRVLDFDNDFVESQRCGIDDMGACRGLRHDFRRDQRSGVKYDQRMPDQRLSANRDQVGCARPRTDEVNRHGAAP